MSKSVRITLSTDSLSAAIHEVNAYKKDIKSKTDKFRERVAEKIRDLAQTSFNGAIVDDIIKGGARRASVKVDVKKEGDVSVVFTPENEYDAVWVEFGAGVYHNRGYLGSSPHPKGLELHFSIGNYGENGKKDTWGFKDDTGIHITHGTPATRPMMNALNEVSRDISVIAREVFA